MRLLILTVLFFVGAFAWKPHSEQETQGLFVSFIRKHGRQYDVDEMFHRYGIFKTNLAFIQQHNEKHVRGEVSYSLALNQFSDLTNSEYKQKLGYKKNPKRNEKSMESHRCMLDSLPDSVDWRTKGAVNPPKDQGQCGSCWTFSATAAMEAAWFFHSNKLLSLSEQLCVDCVNNGANTCDIGGEMHDCYLQVISEGGDELESTYPYTATSGGSCMFDRSQVVATMSSYKNVTTCTVNATRPHNHNNNKNVGSTWYCSEADLKSAAAITVVSVAIDASQQSFQFYSQGVYNEPNCNSCDNLDHGVAVVGYGTEGGNDYWWVRNSWGDSWGLSGYIKMSRNKNNQCGIACDATYPVV